MRTPIDALADRLVRSARATDTMLVRQDRRRFAWVVAVDLTAFIVAVAAMIARPLLQVGFLSGMCAVVLGLQVGRASICGVRRAGTYRNGWLDGRTAFVTAMMEAQNRGMTPAQWLTAELQRDYAVMGLNPGEAEAELRARGIDLDEP
jgi:hypothetical protein